MKETPTAQSVRATAAFYILQSVWGHLITSGNHEALEIIERLKHKHLQEADNPSFMAIRGGAFWKHIDLEEWGQELDYELPEASCEGCGERVSCCQCDGGWNQARRDDDAGRTRIGNTPTCECCDKPLEECAAEQRDILAHYQDDEVGQ